MVFEKELGPKLKETDLISFNSKGIIAWSLWSDGCNAWIPQNLEQLKSLWPSKYLNLEESLREGYNERLKAYIDDASTSKDKFIG